jgi:outer membrane beta-barrel protein
VEIVKTFLALFLLFAIEPARADVVSIPLEELPSESVTPALDSPRAVEQRLLPWTRRWDAEVGTGWILDEPFYQNEFFGARVMYNWNEVSGIGFRYLSWAQGLSDYGSQIMQNNQLNFNYGRGPEKGYALSYENRFIYGKISMAKHVILPVTIQGQFDAGVIQYGSKSFPFLTAGVGNKVFFTPHFGVDLTVKFLLRQAPDPVSQNLKPPSMPAEGDFSTKTRLSSGLDLSLIYLF